MNLLEYIYESLKIVYVKSSNVEKSKIVIKIFNQFLNKMFDLRDDLDEDNKSLESKILNTVIKSLGSK